MRGERGLLGSGGGLGRGEKGRGGNWMGEEARSGFGISGFSCFQS